MYVRVSVCALKRSKSHRNVAEMKLSQMAKKKCRHNVKSKCHFLRISYFQK